MACSTGHVIVWVLCSHTSQVTTVPMKLGGTGGSGWVHAAGSPMQTSLIVYVAVHSAVGHAAGAVKQYSIV